MLEEYKKFKKRYYILLFGILLFSLGIYVIIRLQGYDTLISMDVMLIIEAMLCVLLLLWRVKRFVHIFNKRTQQLLEDCQIPMYVNETIACLNDIKGVFERMMLTLMLASGYLYLENYERSLYYFSMVSKGKLSRGQRFQIDIFIGLMYLHIASPAVLHQHIQHIQSKHDLHRLRRIKQLERTFQTYEILQNYDAFNQQEMTYETLLAYEKQTQVCTPLQRSMKIKRILALLKRHEQDEAISLYEKNLETIPQYMSIPIEPYEGVLFDKAIKRKGQIWVLVALIIQMGLCIMLHVVFFKTVTLFKTQSENNKNIVEVDKTRKDHEDVYSIVLKQDGKQVYEKYIKSFHKVKSKVWMSDSIIVISYEDERYKNQVLAFSFDAKSKRVAMDRVPALLQKEIEKEKQKTNKILEKEEIIKDETGYKLNDLHNVYVTYDYGKHWRDTGINSSELTFSTGNMLRLSDESYLITKTYSYFYYVDGHGYLNYSYSTDEGKHWTHQSYSYAAYDVSWFQATSMDVNNPAFLMSDKIEGTLAY